MDNLSGYAHRPFPFVLRYLRQRLAAHVVILSAVVAAVACSVGTQYGVKNLVDSLSAGRSHAGGVWLAFVFLMSLIAADNFLWRIASWTASFTFVGVTGDLRRDMFRHLTGHAPSYFSDRLPGMLTSRITATSNAVFTVENMFVWNVLPPCIATVSAIALIGTVSVPMSLGMIAIAGTMVVAMFHLAAAGKPLHDDFANKAAAVDGEMVDVINNMPLVRAFCGLGHEHDRFDATVNRELDARGRSLRYLEKLRLAHAAVTVVLTIGMLAWAVNLWQKGLATTGDVVLVCTLGISILSATRDLAVALVDVTQHVARLTEAIATLLQPHELKDHPEAGPLVRSGAAVAFNNVTFGYPGGLQVFDKFSLRIQPGQRVGLVVQARGEAVEFERFVLALLLPQEIGQEEIWSGQEGAVLNDPPQQLLCRGMFACVRHHFLSVLLGEDQIRVRLRTEPAQQGDALVLAIQIAQTADAGEKQGRIVGESL